MTEQRPLRSADAGVWCYGYLEAAVDHLLAIVDGQNVPPPVAAELRNLRQARQRAAEAWEGRQS
jgi:hypothetical protein